MNTDGKKQIVSFALSSLLQEKNDHRQSGKIVCVLIAFAGMMLDVKVKSESAANQ